MDEAMQGADVELEAGGKDREVARSRLGFAAVRALELSDQATEKALQLNRRRRRKYRRMTKKQARKLDRHVARAAQRLQVARPVAKRRRRGRRFVLFVVFVGCGLAAYLAWRARQEQGGGEAAEAGPTPDFADAALDEDGRQRSTTDIASP